MSRLDIIKRNHYLIPAIKTIKSLGFDGVQVMCQNPHQMPITANQLSKLLSELGLELASVGAYRPFNEFENYKMIIDYAAEAGAKLVCSHSGTDSMQSIIACVAMVKDYARSRGIIIAMENSPHSTIKSVEDLLHVCEETGVLVNFDPANLNLVDENVVESIKKLGNRIIQVHVKDSLVSGKNFIFPSLGKGSVPWKECLAALKDIGYDSYLIVEYEGRGNPLEAVKQSKLFLEQLVS
ncbi:MAG: sugar phosphate isomerase/epimerase family protein [Candidatus Aenigmatarchaeota archaeon]